MLLALIMIANRSAFDSPFHELEFYAGAPFLVVMMILAGTPVHHLAHFLLLLIAIPAFIARGAMKPAKFLLLLYSVPTLILLATVLVANAYLVHVGTFTLTSRTSTLVGNYTADNFLQGVIICLVVGFPSVAALVGAIKSPPIQTYSEAVPGAFPMTNPDPNSYQSN
ncbi:MAG TPA: hypothetical protein PK402_01810 [Tepidisphaeraceae bacterium]|nr:hypothetical protein [Tepidisphaeraceae bacterium]